MLASNGRPPMVGLEIHSRLSQSARTRVSTEFREATTGVLFASDVAARGLDYPNVTKVHMDRHTHA
jgi:ATP-dependent RNA helicase MSS116